MNEDLNDDQIKDIMWNERCENIVKAMCMRCRTPKSSCKCAEIRFKKHVTPKEVLLYRRKLKDRAKRPPKPKRNPYSENLPDE